MPPAGWIAIGTGIGTALGVAINNIGAGIALGTGIGIVMMVAMQAKARDEQDKQEDNKDC